MYVLPLTLTHSRCHDNLGNADEEHARALEEQWIDALGSGGGSGSASAESDSRARAVLNGIIIGFFFPLLPFFFLRAPKPAAFWDNGQALETSESTVFSCVFFLSVLFFRDQGLTPMCWCSQPTYADGPGRGFHYECYVWDVAIPLGYILNKIRTDNLFITSHALLFTTRVLRAF